MCLHLSVFFERDRTCYGIPWKAVTESSFQGALDPSFTVSWEMVHEPQDTSPGRPVTSAGKGGGPRCTHCYQVGLKRAF